LWKDDPWPANEPGVDYKRIYDEKYRIAKFLQPKHIAEIGVRAGYSAIAFLAFGNVKSYVGFDIGDSGGSGGTPGALAYAKKILPEMFPLKSIGIETRDTQSTLLGELTIYENIDLFHVDGDHSFNGCIHDLLLAYTCRPKWILIDDCKHHEDTVGIAVALFLQKHRLNHIMLDTVRGDCLIQVCP